MKQSRVELLRHLQEQVAFLRLSAAAFDAGATAEAKRLAVQVRTLVHDTKQSKSLLGQLGFRNTKRFLSTANVEQPGNLVPFTGLVGFRMSRAEISYYAPLELGTNRPRRYVLFAEWWNECVIDDRTSRFNRRDLVLALANKDGGAHVDAELEQPYAELSRNNSIGWMAHDRHGHRDLAGVELYSVRQIAYEVILSVEKMSAS